jgi:hypothetical protein
MYIEDIIDKIVGIGSWVYTPQVSFLGDRDRRFLTSICEQTARQSGLTEKQANLCLTIITKHLSQISAYLSKDLSVVVQNPQFRLPRRVINQTKDVKIYKDQKTNEKKIRISFPYDEGLIVLIKEYKHLCSRLKNPDKYFSTVSAVEWNQDTKTWDFLLTEENIAWCHKNLVDKGFTFDNEFTTYLEDIKKIKDQVENYIPMVVFKNSQFEYQNIHKNTPQPTSTDLLEVLFEAKKQGISTWDENIDLALSDISINDFTRAFFKNTASQITAKNNLYEIFDLEDVINLSNKIAVVIPGGSELESLKIFHKFLLGTGIRNEEMAVLFRLDSNAGKMCNDYVKENGLNNQFGENIKIIFVSIKLPKPVISSDAEFDVIINLGNNSAHYTVKNLIKNHHCVINYNVKIPKNSLSNGNL